MGLAYEEEERGPYEEDMRKKGESIRKWGFSIRRAKEETEEKGLDIGLGKAWEREIPIGSALL